jgi:hypothetical protein
MRRISFTLFTSLCLLLAAFGTIHVARGQPAAQDGPVVLAHETQDGNVREIIAPNASSLGEAPQQPAISFIDSPTAVCYQPDPAQDACYLNWYYMSVNAAPNYMIAMTVTVNALGPVARMQGFFQTSMYAPYNLFGEGFQVACGALGAGGQPELGNAYAWTINARDSSNLASANYGTAYCPAFAP